MPTMAAHLLQLSMINPTRLSIFFVSSVLVALSVVGVTGQGNLLGNLICAVVGLLDSGGALSGLLQNLVSLLNQILGAL